jgi:hypothetical protein
MYSVALVQNQSEMSHYGYADARPLLDGYGYRLFTGDNIAGLGAALATRSVDALVIGSNALNDRDILRTLCSAEFATGLGDYLETGRGVLCLQQLGLAMRKGPCLDLLPGSLGHLRPVVRPEGESALSPGNLAASESGAHVVLGYPAAVDPETVRSRACEFRGLPGLYWHYWDQVDLTRWDVVLSDTSNPVHRALLLVSKESGPWRAVVSALPLDWQRHESLFRNALVYAVEGRHHLAVLDMEGRDLAFDYLRSVLRARRTPFAEYVLPGDGVACARNIDTAIHSTLLIGPGVRLAQLPVDLAGPLERGVNENRLRIVDLADGVFGTRRVSVLSRELRPLALLHETEVRMQAELRDGYIDDSFWSHVETLQTVDRMPDRIIDYGHLQGAAFAIAKNHERAHSYDEVFGPTCAFYWLRARYLGPDSAAARCTAEWLRSRLPTHDPHERALAYLMFATVGRLEKEEAADLHAMVAARPATELSETEALLYLRAVLAAEPAPPDLVASLSTILTDRQRDGVWVDLTTTATATAALLDAHRVLAADGHADVRRRIEAAALAAVTYILRVLAHAQAHRESHPYPWDGKARTTTKCLQAWLQFDVLLDLPVAEMLDLLPRWNMAAAHAGANRSVLAVLETASEENTRLRTEMDEFHGEVARLGADVQGARTGEAEAARRVRHRNLALLFAGLACYLLLTLLVGSLVGSGRDLGRAFSVGFLKGWQFHSWAIGIAFTVVGLTAGLRKRSRGEKAAGGSEDSR